MQPPPEWQLLGLPPPPTPAPSPGALPPLTEALTGGRVANERRRRREQRRRRKKKGYEAVTLGQVPRRILEISPRSLRETSEMTCRRCSALPPAPPPPPLPPSLAPVPAFPTPSALASERRGLGGRARGARGRRRRRLWQRPQAAAADCAGGALVPVRAASPSISAARCCRDVLTRARLVSPWL